MDQFIELTFRFILYTFFGLSMEIIFSVTGIQNALGKKTPLKLRLPKKYLEGFVSLYMIPLHGLGILFLFEPVHHFIAEFHIIIRYLIWSLAITALEVFWGFFLHKTVGFYSWDYYKDSKYKIFKEGYSLWTLVPLWGVAGLILEVYTSLLVYLSPYVAHFFKSM